MVYTDKRVIIGKAEGKPWGNRPRNLVAYEARIQ